MPTAHLMTFANPFRVKTEARLEELELFIRITHHACKDVARISKKKLEAKLSRVLKEDGPNALTHQMFLVGQFVRAHYVTMPQSLNSLFVILVYNLFEELGQSLRTELMRQKGISEPVELQKFLKEFKDFATSEGITFSKWSALDDLTKVRNNILHRGSFLPGGKKGKNLRRIIKNNSPALSMHGGQIQFTVEYVVKNLHFVREFLLEALRQKKFENGYSFGNSSDTPFALLANKDKVSIKIVESANVGELKLPTWEPIKVIEFGDESDINTLKDELDLFDPDDGPAGTAFCEGLRDNPDIPTDGISEPGDEEGRGAQ
jgi:hypothetical protein